MEENKILSLCDYLATSVDPTSTRWGWGEGLLAYAFIKYDLANQLTNHIDYAKKYIDYYVINKPEMDCSDRIVPSLAAYELYYLTKDEKYLGLIDLAKHYIDTCEKVIDDIPNHFGTSKKESNYPKSIWIDSIMMLSYFTSVYGKNSNDETYLDLTYRQLKTYARCLMDEKTNLWHHAYWVKENLKYPKGNLFWARGNGWVALGLPLIYENLVDEKQKKEIREIYQKSIDAMLKYQKRDGSFKTLIARSETVKETSATALIAAGIYKAVLLNMIDKSYLDKANLAYCYCMKNIKIEKNGTFFYKISGSTVPLEKHPYLWYVTRKEKINANYGVFAILLATIFKKEFN